MGRRLGELTRHNTKCMVEVNGVSLIDRVLTQLARIDIERVIIVTGYKGRELTDYIGRRYDGRLNIEYAENPVYDKTNNIYSLWMVKDRLQQDDTLLIESDLIFSDRLFPMILGDPHPNVALVAKYESWMDGTMVTIDQERNILNFITKKAFSYSDIDRYYKTVNIYKFSKEFATGVYVPFLEAYVKALGNNEYYEQVLRVITLMEGADLKALPIGGEKWYEIDDVQDLDIAETIFAEDDEIWKNYSRRFGGFWRFPQMLDYNYLVNPFFPTKRLTDEMQSCFSTLLTTYPSGMAVNSLLAGKCFGVKREYIVPGNGAAELIKIVMERCSGRLGVVFPTFEEYPNRKDTAHTVVFHPANADFSYTADDLMAYFAGKQISTLLLINPDNPSGNFIPRADVLRLADWCESQGARLLVDESFVDFSTGYATNSLLDNATLEAHPRMLVMKSISKSFGIPGLRLGILAGADTALISDVKRQVSIWNINSFAEFFMQIFSKHEADYTRACGKFLAERSMFEQELRQIPYLRVIPSEANYFLCEIVNAGFTATQLAQRLIKTHNILIKDCSYKKAFGGKQYVRIAVRDRRDNTRLIAALTCLIHT